MALYAGTSKGTDEADEFTLVARSTRTVLSSEFVRQAYQLMSRSGIADVIEGWIKEDHKAPGGANPRVPVLAALVGDLLAACEFGTTCDTKVAEVLFRKISDEDRKLLGIRSARRGPTKDSPEAQYAATNRTMRKIVDSFDPSETLKNRIVRKSSPDEAAPKARDLTIHDQQIRQARMEWVTHELLYLTFLLLPRKVRKRYRGTLSIDATPLRQFTRGFSRKSMWHSADPDCAWFARDKDTPAEATQFVESTYKRIPAHRYSTNNRKTAFWGLECSIGVTTSENLHGYCEYPTLALGLVVDRPGFNVGENATLISQNVLRRVGKAGFLAGDRAYTNSKAEKFQIPATKSGYELVIDYRDDQLGIQGNHQGAILVEGAWYCPSMPKKLIDATRDLRAGEIDDSTYRLRITERARYQMRIKDTTARGYRIYCPATGPSPTAVCPLRDDTKQVSTSVDEVRVVIRPRKELLEDTPKSCTQSAVSVSKDVGAKFLQHHQFGSEEHQKRYALMRSTMEGYNGTAKDGLFEGLGDPHRRRRRGIAGQTLAATILLMATNIRMIDTFLKNAKEGDDGILRTKRSPRAARKTADDAFDTEPTSAEPSSRRSDE